MKIHKYPITPGQTTNIVVPFGSRVLSVGLQHDKMMAWVETSDGECDVSLALLAVGTGHEFEIHPNARFIGTIIMDAIGCVVHCYQL